MECLIEKERSNTNSSENDKKLFSEQIEVPL